MPSTNTFTLGGSILLTFAITASAQDATTTSYPCPTTLTVPGPTALNGCTTTIWNATATASINCHGCEHLTSVTSYNPWLGLGPACGPRVTVTNSTGTTTVTSCSTTATGYLPEAPAQTTPPSAFGDECLFRKKKL